MDSVVVLQKLGHCPPQDAMDDGVHDGGGEDGGGDEHDGGEHFR